MLYFAFGVCYFIVLSKFKSKQAYLLLSLKFLISSIICLPLLDISLILFAPPILSSTKGFVYLTFIFSVIQYWFSIFLLVLVILLAFANILYAFWILYLNIPLFFLQFLFLNIYINLLLLYILP